MSLANFIPDMQYTDFQNRWWDKPQPCYNRFITGLWVHHLPFALLHSRCLRASELTLWKKKQLRDLVQCPRVGRIGIGQVGKLMDFMSSTAWAQSQRSSIILQFFFLQQAKVKTCSDGKSKQSDLHYHKTSGIFYNKSMCWLWFSSFWHLVSRALQRRESSPLSYAFEELSRSDCKRAMVCVCSHKSGTKKRRRTLIRERESQKLSVSTTLCLQAMCLYEQAAPFCDSLFLTFSFYYLFFSCPFIPVISSYSLLVVLEYELALARLRRINSVIPRPVVVCNIF